MGRSILCLHHLLVSSLLIFTLLLIDVHASKKCYIIYLGAHSHGPTPSSVDLDTATSSHYDLLGSILGSKENAKEAIIYSYNKQINGFAAILEEEEAAQIAKNPKVVSVFLSKEHKLHTTRSWEFLGLRTNDINSAWQKGRFGENTIIANIDTGVWPESKSFDDRGIGPIPAKWRGGNICQINKLKGSKKVPCNRKLIGARFFNRAYELYNGKLPRSQQTARDFLGHGTHTLSTAGGNFVPGASIFGIGNGTVKGGSPKSRVVTYKVCWSPKTRDASAAMCFGADVLAAIEQAISDGVDIISLSAAGQYLKNPEDIFTDEVSIGAFHALSRNILLVASAGNDGPTPGSVANIAPWVFTVAASTIDRDFSSTMTIGNKTVTGASLFVKLPPDQSFTLVHSTDVKFANVTNQAARFCKPGTLDPSKVSGKIVECVAEEILPNNTFVSGHLLGFVTNSVSQGKEAFSAGAEAMILNWGKGANGRLGHGDIDDRKSPTLVEALKERHVKNISCGSSFTSCICIHKWVSGVDQSSCTGCRQPFGFTRKRHNCYNCGLVHCHGCSSRKVMKAALAPTPGKPHRVCDSCYTKLKAVEANTASNLNRKVTITQPRSSIDGRDRFGQGETVRSTKILFPPFSEPLKYLEMRTNKLGNSSMLPTSQIPSIAQMKDISFPSSTSSIQNGLKYPLAPTPPSTPPLNARSVSPYARRPSPPRSSSPGFSRSIIDSMKKTNELLNQQVSKLQNQNRNLKQKSTMEIQKLHKNIKDATSLAAEESSKHRATKEYFGSMIAQLKEMAEQLPPEFLEGENFRNMVIQAESFLEENPKSETCSVASNLESDQQSEPVSNNGKLKEKIIEENNNEAAEVNPSQDVGNAFQENNGSSSSNTEATAASQSSENDSRTLNPSRSAREGNTQVVEQFEPGVYVTLIVRPDGKRLFKSVKFSKRKFREHQAEEWWTLNKDRVHARYSPQATNPENVASSSSTPPPANQEDVASSSSNPPPAEENNEATPPS